jgi:hypothetical protein
MVEVILFSQDMKYFSNLGVLPSYYGSIILGHLYNTYPWPQDLISLCFVYLTMDIEKNNVLKFQDFAKVAKHMDEAL